MMFTNVVKIVHHGISEKIMLANIMDLTEEVITAYENPTKSKEIG